MLFKFASNLASGLVVAGLAVFALCGAAPAPPDIITSLHFQPGQRQMSQSMNLGPDAGQVQTRTACFTQAQLQADATAPLKPSPPPGREAVTCDTRRLMVDGMAIRFETRCAMPFGVLTTQWQGSVSEMEFIVVGRAQFLHRVLETKVSGKRLGDCPV